MLRNFLQKRSVWAKAVAMVLVSAMLFGSVAPVMAYYAAELDTDYYEVEEPKEVYEFEKEDYIETDYVEDDVKYEQAPSYVFEETETVAEAEICLEELDEWILLFAAGVPHGEFPPHILAHFLAREAAPVFAEIEPFDNTIAAPLGSGTEADPFVITTAGQLRWMAQQVNAMRAPYSTAHYRLDNDISLSGFASGQGWDPIGNSGVATTTATFRGVFDGGNHRISGLSISRARDNIGLFGVLDGNAVVKNLSVSGNVRGEVATGGVVGSMRGASSVINVHFSGSVTNTDMGIAGGVVGSVNGGANFLIENTSSTGTVTGRTALGGIVGTIMGSGTMSNNTSDATIRAQANARVGGIVGFINNLSTPAIRVRAEFNFARNPVVHNPGTNPAGRVIGWSMGSSPHHSPLTTLSNNFAIASMRTDGGAGFHPPGHTRHDGWNGADFDGNIQVMSVVVEPREVRAAVGSNVSLRAIVTPAAATNRNVTWRSDNPAAATVDASGNVTLISDAYGTVRIFAETANGRYGYAVITVFPPQPEGNIARDINGGVMSASSESTVRRLARMANNGNPSATEMVDNSWQPYGVGEEWLMVNFGVPRYFDIVRIHQFGPRIMNYRFEHSNDGINWTVFHTGTQMRTVVPDFYEVRLATAANAQFIRLFVGNSLNDTPVVVVEFEVFYGSADPVTPPVTVLPGINIAHQNQGAAATASSPGLANRPASRVNDGVTFGQPIESWIAPTSGAEYIRIDFGQERIFNTIRIYQAGTRIRNYTFQYSHDGVNWNYISSGSAIMVASTATVPNGYQVDIPTPIQARFVRLHSEFSSQPATPIALFEFVVGYNL